jgi:predicted Zn-dependent peptidase
MPINRKQQPDIQELSEFTLLPAKRIVLPNGIPVMIVNSEEQDICRIDFMFGGGSWTQEQKMQAFITNSMLREGTLSYTSVQLAEKIDFYGSTLELSMFPQYVYITSYSLNKYFEQMAELINSMIREPAFPEEEFGVLMSREYQKFQINSSRVKYLTMRNLRNALYGDSHPMGKILCDEDFKKLTTDCLRRYFNRTYNSDNCSIILSGKITDKVLMQVERIFGTDRFGESHQRVVFPTYPISVTSEKRLFEERDDARQSSVMMGMHSINQQHPDYCNLNVLVTIFGGYFGSRLMSNIREDKGYTYGIYSGFSHEPDSSLLVVTAEVSGQYVEPMIKEVYREIDRLQNEPVGEDELAVVRSYMTGGLCRTMELSFSAADVYQLQFINGLPDNFQEQKLKAIQTVTPQELQRLAQRYLCKEKLKEVISGKKNL